MVSLPFQLTVALFSVYRCSAVDLLTKSWPGLAIVAYKMLQFYMESNALVTCTCTEVDPYVW